MRGNAPVILYGSPLQQTAFCFCGVGSAITRARIPVILTSLILECTLAFLCFTEEGRVDDDGKRRVGVGDGFVMTQTTSFSCYSKGLDEGYEARESEWVRVDMRRWVVKWTSCEITWRACFGYTRLNKNEKKKNIYIVQVMTQNLAEDDTT